MPSENDNDDSSASAIERIERELARIRHGLNRASLERACIAGVAVWVLIMLLWSKNP